MTYLPRLTRRRFLGLLGGAAALGLYTWRVEPHWVEFVHRDLPIPGLPDSLVGKTLVQLSDLHVGPRVDSAFLEHSLRLVNDLRPDLVCITGDFMTCDGGEQIDEAARVMESLAVPPMGCLAVLGNHDYGHGGMRGSPRLEVADRLVSRLTDLGIETLRNASRQTGGLRVIGLDDLWKKQFDAAPVAADLASPSPSVVLCHNPDAVDLDAFADYRGWILSGHTHGGQCKPPFLPPPVLPVRNKRYTAGAFDLGDGRHLYINRALGYLRRVRFNVRPEVTVFRLTAA
jgi:predicted MPP superfamily phosphohydrolase